MLENSRGDYEAAVRAIDRGQWTEFERLRPGLDDYPLAVYLDYFRMSSRPAEVRPSQARQFIDLSADTPLPIRFLGTYLRRAGRDQRWGDFLAVQDSEPNSIDLKCYYFRARLATGDSLVAWEGAERLWIHGQSRPKECDPLFAAWMKAGQLSDTAVWARMLQAFEERQASLLTYVAGKSSPALKPWADKLLAVYRRPATLRQQSLPADSPYSADIAAAGLAYLARYNPAQALDNWQRYQAELEFSQAQRHKVESEIALRSLFARTEANFEWLHGALARLGDDKLVEIRLRWAISEQDWPALSATLPLLSAQRRESAGWRYWQARALSQAGDDQASLAMLRELARERDFYGFLAADRIGEAYSFNDRPLPLPPASTEPLRDLPAVVRIGELNFHRDEGNAHSEWYKVLQDTDRQEQQEALALLAAQQGWYRMAIDAATRARAWDALDVRFPTPYRDTFRQYASAQGVPSTELMAIARRESAFFPEARSPVGARGLMQIMPATGQQVARSLNRSLNTAQLYEVEHNILLGSAYYRQLLDRFSGNRVFALAAYNAGPHRVDRWRHASGEQVPVDIWIESIPYRETRDYVQAVLAYNVVFQYRTGEPARLLSDSERSALY
ncbi:transglycosylase SLT domain-containing protein [Mangrovimicrobium sediminis]|uniref:transglycosylase SLT domain-containing protein n=1 Tax=Mangrovimicrobium sediminis TaxID=2562682 RepID=UPI001436C0F1|nr:transglycosylase SLT domain-containing protein [Haliea sp. SAOS-164]